ncbi:MAG: glycosyltransferase family 2 protein, partial [Candidatus Binatia bacterium]
MTIIVVPRERFSHSERSLRNLYENTTVPFDLVYVSAGAPERIRRYLETEAEGKKFRLLHADRYLSPNQARNLGLREASTRYVVFLDNDALVAPRWLEALVQCAEETGAWVVGPLYLYGEFERAVIHMAGGTLRLAEQQGKRLFIDEQYLFDTALAAAPVPLSRRRCDYAEFHCMLVRTEAFGRLGELDEKLLSLHEERDFCLAVGRAGGSVCIEPKAVVTFVPPPPCDWSDVPYFMMRWSDSWNI